MLVKLGIAFLWLVHFLPEALINALGQVLGRLVFASGQGHTTLVNLRACFPQWSEAQRRQLARRHFGALTRSFLELGILWWSPRERLAAMIRVHGREHYDVVAHRPVIWLTPHFVGLEMGGAWLGMNYGGVGFFTPHKNPDLDRLIRHARDRLGDVLMLERRAGLRALVKAIRGGRNLYFLPDMDFGDRDGIFVPFFGIPAATVTTLPRLCRLTGAVVVPCVPCQLPGGQGYEIRFHPAWEDFPTEDVVADVTRMNAFIEACAREFPEQYFWIHKRFRTRPEPGAPNFYG